MLIHILNMLCIDVVSHLSYPLLGIRACLFVWISRNFEMLMEWEMEEASYLWMYTIKVKHTIVAFVGTYMFKLWKYE
jgi:hypothetical protein